MFGTIITMLCNGIDLLLFVPNLTYLYIHCKEYNTVCLAVHPITRLLCFAIKGVTYL